MSFDGIVTEFPFLGVDRFNTSACVFLLTHCHQDHLVGLFNRSFVGVVYCTPETRLLLASLTDNASVLTRIKPVDYNKPLEIELPPQIQQVYGNIRVTLLHAYHCLGACMFLVEGEMGGSVLCTGDLRAEKWWVDGLSLLPQLAPYLAGFKTLDNIYLDTTFGYRGEPYIEMPPNNLGIYAAIGLLKKYPMDDPEINYCFRDTVLGFDQAWAFIVSYFGAALEVSGKKLSDVIDLVAKHDPINGPILSQAMANSKKSPFGPAFPRFRAGKKETLQTTVHIVQCIDFNIMDLVGASYPLPLETLSEAEKLLTTNPTRVTTLGNSFVKLRDRLWILPKGGEYLLPAEIKLVFSRHSSYSECAYFVSRLKPRQVYPCWSNLKAWANGFSMSRLFGKYCSGSSFVYDNKMTREFGSMAEIHSGKPVTTIDRWNSAECENEREFVEKVLDAKTNHKAKGALINIRKVAKVAVFTKKRILHLEDPGDSKGTKKQAQALSLDNLSRGNAKSVKAFIEAQQQLYYRKHNLPQYERDFEHPMYHNAFGSGVGGTSEVDSQSSDSSLDLEKMGRKRHTSFSELSTSSEKDSTIIGCTKDWETNLLKHENVSQNRAHSSESQSELRAFKTVVWNHPHIVHEAKIASARSNSSFDALLRQNYPCKRKGQLEIRELMLSSFVASSNSIEDSIIIHRKRLVEEC